MICFDTNKWIGLLLVVFILLGGCRKELGDSYINSALKNEFVYKENVTELMGDDYMDILQIDSSNLLIHSRSTIVKNLKVGDIVLSGGYDSYKTGFLRKILEINMIGENINLVTEHASFTETFEVLNFSKSLGVNTTLNFREDPLSIKLDERSINLEDILQSKAKADRVKAGILQTLDMEDLLLPKDVDISIKASMKLDCKSEINYSSTNQFIDFSFRENYITFSFKPEIKIGGKLVSITDKSITICDLLEEFAPRGKSFCDNNSFTLFSVHGVPIPVGPVTFQVYARISFLLNAVLQGKFNFEIKNKSTEPISNFNIRLSLRDGLQLISTNTDIPVFDPRKTSLGMNGDIKLQGKLGVGVELGLAFYDQEALNINVGSEFYLDAQAIVKGGVLGKLKNYAANLSLTGGFSGKVTANTDIYAKLNSDISNQIGFDPSTWVSIKKNVYSKNLLQFVSNCGNYSNYHFRTKYSKSRSWPEDCNEIGFEFGVEGAAISNNRFDISIVFPDDTVEDFFDETYNQNTYFDVSGRVVEGDEVNVIISSIDDNFCEIANFKYIIPKCHHTEWIPLQSTWGGVTNFTIQKYNLSRGGNNGDCYDDDLDNCRIYGKLYSWDNLIYDNIERSKSYCPEKAVVPSLKNWLGMLGTLERRTNGEVKLIRERVLRNGLYTYEYKGANILKELGYWSNPSEGTASSWLNIYGSGEKFQGNNSGNSPYHFLGESAAFWTSTSISETEAYLVIFKSEWGDLFQIIPATKLSKASCRCIKIDI